MLCVILLLKEFYTTLIDYDFDLDEVTFQQDNAPIYKAKIVLEWFWEQSYSVMDWLAQSLDLNPIKHVQAILKWCLNLYFIPPKNLYELWNYVQDIYATIIVDECQMLYTSILTQFVAVLEEKGR